MAGENGLAVVLSEMHGHTPGRGWIEGVLARRPVGVIAVFSGSAPAGTDSVNNPAVTDPPRGPTTDVTAAPVSSTGALR